MTELLRIVMCGELCNGTSVLTITSVTSRCAPLCLLCPPHAHCIAVCLLWLSACVCTSCKHSGLMYIDAEAHIDAPQVDRHSQRHNDKPRVVRSRA